MDKCIQDTIERMDRICNQLEVIIQNEVTRCTYKTGVMQNGKGPPITRLFSHRLFKLDLKSQKTRERFHKFVDDFVPNPRGEQLESKWDK